MIGEALFFIAKDKGWSVKYFWTPDNGVKYFWTPDNGRLHFVATNAARKKKVTSKGLRKTSLAYLFLNNPGAERWWLAEHKGEVEKLSEEGRSSFSFKLGGVVVDRRTVLMVYNVIALQTWLHSMEVSQAFLYRLRGGIWKPKRIKLDGLPRPAPDLNGDGIKEVLVVTTYIYRARTSEFSELIWWDKKAAKFIKSGIQTQFHFGDAPLRGPYQEFKESTLQFHLKAKPFPLIIVRVQRKKRSDKTEEIEKLGSLQRDYQWDPGKRKFVQISGK